MGPVMLELKCPQNVDGIAIDPEPDWSFDSILLELNSIEKKLNASPLPFTKTNSRDFSALKGFDRSPGAFIMRVLDEDMEEDKECDGDWEEFHRQPLAAGRRFAYISDSEDSEHELDFELEGGSYLMEKVGVVESALSELSHEHHLRVTEEVRNQISAVETDLTNINEKFASAIACVEKCTEERREMEKKLDLQYRRTVAEGQDRYLTGVQRKHEHRSQIEERRIRDDAAHEEAKRRQEEKHRQEKIKAEEEMCARHEAEIKRAEDAKALEAQRAAKEAEAKAVTENIRKAEAVATSLKGTAQYSGARADGSKKLASAGNFLKGAESALKLEERRLQIYKEVAAEIEASGLRNNEDFRSYGMQIARRIRTINGTWESVRTKAHELINLISGSAYPRSSIVMFAEKVVSQCANPTGSFGKVVYAYANVIVLVTSQVPQAMEILLAELNRVCIYTVPKYIIYSESTFETKEAYRKAIGYQEEDGKLESTDIYIARVMSCMKLYGALVQTEVEGGRNLHGIEEGWAWIARLLNALPPNLCTAVAMQAFLEMAGFALYRRYRSQFKKLLNIISRNFLKTLGHREDPKLTKVVMSIQNYIDSNKYLKEPEGWRLQSSSLSKHFVPEIEQHHHHSSNNYFY